MRHLILFHLITLAGIYAFGASDLFGDKQWGLHNDGTSQIIDLDPMHTYRVPARSGEDVHMPSTVNASKKVIVAVLDTGIQKNHPDLKNNIVRKESECRALEKFLACEKDKDRKECETKWMDPKNPEVDQDRNGYPMDCQGWSLMGGKNAAGILGRPDFDDDQGHGTHVAGIIAAIANNGIGVAGISNNVAILPVQVLGEQPSEPIKPYSIDLSPSDEQRPPMRSLGDSVARGVIYAINSGAQVISFSMGWPAGQDSDLMREAIAEAQRRGIIIVAAAGNDSTRALLRPCTYPGVICVGATGPDGALAHFSNFGSGVEIAAPGVNILSTYPEEVRPVRFRSTLGYEYLSGTSQATPFVTGAVAELLARGVPSSEIYPRLVLGSRALQTNLNLVENFKGGSQTITAPNTATPKYLLAGQLDVARALSVSAQPLIAPATKEKIEIQWNRQASSLDVEVSLINRWQAVDSSKVNVQFYFSKPHAESVRPAVLAVNPKQNYSGTWNQNEVRTFLVRLQTAPRMPGELDLIGQVTLPSGTQRRFIMDVDVTVPVSPNMKDADVQILPITGLPEEDRLSFIPIDENLDDRPQARDYVAYTEDDTTRKLWLVKQDSRSKYQVVGGTEIELEGEADNLRSQVSTRLDMDMDGRSEYVLGFLEESEDEETKTSMQFFVFDQDLRLKTKFKYVSEKALIPYQFSWHLSHGKKLPAWVGGGKDPQKERSLRDRWENPTGHEAIKTRFYYMENETTLRSLEDYQGFKFVDVLEPSPAQVLRGAVSVLLTKNEGTEAKSSFLYKFAIAEVIDGKVQNFSEMDFFGDDGSYRNIFETRVDRSLSTNADNRIYSGNFWFGEGKLREQRISQYDNKNMDIIDGHLQAQNQQTDSALWVRAAFSGDNRNGAFVLTNSEIQYHDLDRNNVASHSMERYTFYPDMLMTNLYYPTTLGDSKNSAMRLPALFTTEKSGLSRGVKMFVPVFARDSKVIEVVSPARLRFKSMGCIPMETPVFVGGSTGHALDYICKDKVLRIPLNY
ncbi:S8 family serine peptidase [Bdellovibrio sp. HCB337]|uniref:S8 family serine peptidase n=1 Tax=Bdellovibrio sp. HCB337 TaxID=3394358 RepID=UPI0039A46B81